MTKYVPRMLTYQEVDSFLYDFLQGSLPFSKQLKFKVNISLCSECRAYVKDYKDTVRLLKEGFTVSEPNKKVPKNLVLAIFKVRK